MKHPVLKRSHPTFPSRRRRYKKTRKRTSPRSRLNPCKTPKRQQTSGRQRRLAPAANPRASRTRLDGDALGILVAFSQRVSPRPAAAPRTNPLKLYACVLNCSFHYGNGYLVFTARTGMIRNSKKGRFLFATTYSRKASAC